MNGVTVTEAEVCYRKFVEDRRACRGRMRSHHDVTNSAERCCRKHGQGYAERVSNGDWRVVIIIIEVTISYKI